jgi:CheY-like chemotaxis protein
LRNPAFNIANAGEASIGMSANGQPVSRVLLVDDNQAVARSLAALLRGEGYEPVIFLTGAPAMEYCRNHCPDIALIDIHLPDISGLELSRQIRNCHGVRLPIIILSGDTSMDMLKTLPQSGASYFLSKPISASTLLESLKTWMATPPS